MKKQLILSLVVVFALAFFAPAVVSAMDSNIQIENVDNDEKKVEKKAENKSEAKAEAKSDCTTAKKTSCCGSKAVAKSDCATAKKADCSSKKEAKK